MEDLTRILADLDQSNITITIEDDGLSFNGPVGSLTHDLKEKLLVRKSDIIAYLQDNTLPTDSRKSPHADNYTHQPSDCDTEAIPSVDSSQEPASARADAAPSVDQAAKEVTTPRSHQSSLETTLGEWLQEEPIRRIRSNVLDEDILIASDDAEICCEPEAVVYRHSEIKRLIGMPTEKLRAIHTAKKILDGDIL